ncbi:hypothetical protein [Anaerovibrio sp. JC8]|uniref:hypothetical protein n=1 Tax=Anaerovibrio sp. JC8 TaxID=1240085 RepID=UPI001301F8CD|nr:hypothetical protein [Anaerovibrio sp. JC8]
MFELDLMVLAGLFIGAGVLMGILLIVGLCEISGRCSRMEEQLEYREKIVC